MEQPKDWIDDLPRLRMSPREFMALPEYSATFPTGTTPGKKWRRLVGAHDIDWRRRGGKPYWMIGQYDPNCSADAKEIKILWFKPVISV